MNKDILCPCGDNRKMSQCCGRFLNGAEHAKTPEQLMRSRFTAYFLGGYGEYLLKTWFKAAELGLAAEELSRHSVNWQKLEVLNTSDQGDRGEVEFNAYYSGHGKLLLMHERSLFKRIKGIWYYVKPA